MYVMDLLLELDGKQCCNLHLNKLYLTHMLSLFLRHVTVFLDLGTLERTSTWSVRAFSAVKSPIKSGKLPQAECDKDTSARARRGKA